MTGQNTQYRQLTWQALQAAGLTPGDAHEYYQQVVSKNSGITAGGETKTGWSILDQGRDTNADAHAKKQEENERHFEEQRQETERRMEQQREQEQLAAENRPAEDRQNARIMGLPMQMTGFLFGLGLAGEAVEATGNMLSPGFDRIGDQMMVVGSTGNGAMLDEARQALGVSNPSTQDMMVTGPNQVAAFTPGEAPQMDAPGAEPGLNPLAQRNMSMAAMPGLSGPTFGPKR